MSAPHRARIGMVVTRGHESIFLRCMGGIVNRCPQGRFDVVVLCSASAIGTVQKALHHPDVSVAALPEHFPSAAATIVAAACDVLYYWEIGSDALNYFLPFLRLAPMQCTSWSTLACYRRMGLTDLIAESSDEYVQLAVRVGTDRNFRRFVTSRIAERSDVLFDDQAAVDEHVRFFAEMVPQTFGQPIQHVGPRHVCRVRLTRARLTASRRRRRTWAAACPFPLPDSFGLP
jgi:hypothetical protein